MKPALWASYTTISLTDASELNMSQHHRVCLDWELYRSSQNPCISTQSKLFITLMCHSLLLYVFVHENAQKDSWSAGVIERLLYTHVIEHHRHVCSSKHNFREIRFSCAYVGLQILSAAKWSSVHVIPVILSFFSVGVVSRTKIQLFLLFFFFTKWKYENSDK